MRRMLIVAQRLQILREQVAALFGVLEDLFLFNARFDAQTHFYDNAVIRPLRTPTRRSWQPGGFG